MKKLLCRILGHQPQFLKHGFQSPEQETQVRAFIAGYLLASPVFNKISLKTYNAFLIPALRRYKYTCSSETLTELIEESQRGTL